MKTEAELIAEIAKLLNPFAEQEWTPEAKAEAKRVLAEYVAGLKASPPPRQIEVIESSVDEAGMLRMRLRIPSWMAHIVP